jgi:hypothetical protein
MDEDYTPFITATAGEPVPAFDEPSKIEYNLFNKTATERTREEWLSECADLMLLELFTPITTIRSSMRIKVSVGYAPNTKANSNVIGCCLSSVCSGEGYNEIFISPTINDSSTVLATLAHEICHAIDDNKSGHRGEFARLARAVGLAGKLTATTAGDKLQTSIDEYIDIMGEIPHSAVDLSSKPRQKNRNLKVWCDSCGFKFNTSITQINHVIETAGCISCPACARDMQHNGGQ